MFSECVPRDRCSGLQHFGLSHECMTTVFLVGSPIAGAISIAHATTRWGEYSLWSIFTLPYPLAVVAPCHSQQPESIIRHRIKTWSRERCLSLVAALTRIPCVGSSISANARTKASSIDGGFCWDSVRDGLSSFRFVLSTFQPLLLTLNPCICGLRGPVAQR